MAELECRNVQNFDGNHEQIKMHKRFTEGLR